MKEHADFFDYLEDKLSAALERWGAGEAEAALDLLSCSGAIYRMAPEFRKPFEDLVEQVDEVLNNEGVIRGALAFLDFSTWLEEYEAWREVVDSEEYPASYAGATEMLEGYDALDLAVREAERRGVQPPMDLFEELGECTRSIFEAPGVLYTSSYWSAVVETADPALWRRSPELHSALQIHRRIERLASRILREEKMERQYSS